MGLGRLGERVGGRKGLGRPSTPSRDEVAPGMLGHGLEPGAKAATRVILKLAKGSKELDEHLLGHIDRRRNPASPTSGTSDEYAAGTSRGRSARPPDHQDRAEAARARSARCRNCGQPSSARPQNSGGAGIVLVRESWTRQSTIGRNRKEMRTRRRSINLSRPMALEQGVPVIVLSTVLHRGIASNACWRRHNRVVTSCSAHHCMTALVGLRRIACSIACVVVSASNSPRARYRSTATSAPSS